MIVKLHIFNSVAVPCVMSDKQSGSTLPPLSGGGTNNGGSNSGGSQQAVNLHQVLTTQGLNVLTTGGQQFVLTSQVPGLTQVIGF